MSTKVVPLRLPRVSMPAPSVTMEAQVARIAEAQANVMRKWQELGAASVKGALWVAICECFDDPRNDRDTIGRVAVAIQAAVRKLGV